MKANKITSFEVGGFYLYNSYNTFICKLETFNIIEDYNLLGSTIIFNGFVNYYNTKYKIRFYLLDNGYIVKEILGVEKK